MGCSPLGRKESGTTERLTLPLHFIASVLSVLSVKRQLLSQNS